MTDTECSRQSNSIPSAAFRPENNPLRQVRARPLKKYCLNHSHARATFFGHFPWTSVIAAQLKFRREQLGVSIEWPVWREASG